MNLTEIIKICKKGKTGIIPNWKGYLDWDYSINQIYFHNGDYRINEDKLIELLKDRNDLYYII